MSTATDEPEVAGRTSGWQRIEIFSKANSELSQFVLDTVDWSDCTIAYSGSVGDVEKFEIDVKGRCLLATEPGHRFFTLKAAVAHHAREKSVFSEKSADAGEALLDAFGIMVGGVTIIEEIEANRSRRTLSDIVNTQPRLHLYFVTDLASHKPIVLSALGIGDSDLVGTADHTTLLGGREPWAKSLYKPGTADLKHEYVSWVTSEHKRMCFGLRRVLRDDGVARYALEMRMPVGMRRSLIASQLYLQLGPLPEFVKDGFFVLYRLVQRQATDLAGRRFTGDGTAHWIFEIEGVSEASVWKLWNERLLAERLRALRAIEGNSAVSPLPAIRLRKSPTEFHDDDVAGRPYCPIVTRTHGWRVIADLVDSTGEKARPDYDAIAAGVQIFVRGAAPLQPAADNKTSFRAKPAAELEFPLFRCHDGTELKLPVNSVAHRWPKWLPGSAGTAAIPGYAPDDEGPVTPRMRDSALFLCAEFKFSAGVPTKEVACAVGAFDLIFPQAADTNHDGQSFILVAALSDDEDARSWPYKVPPARAVPDFVGRPKRTLKTLAEGTLQLVRLLPGGQDASAEAQAEGRLDPAAPPILIRPGDSGAVSSDGLMLGILETTPSPADRAPILELREPWGPANSGRSEVSRFLRLTVRLQSQDSRLSEKFRVISLETAPFLVVSFEIEAEQGIAEAPGTGDQENVLAEARQQVGQSLTWRFSRLGQTVMRLPAQAVGEAMEKSTLLEDISEGGLVDLAFGLPTEVRINPEDRAKALVEVPWNARRMFTKADGFAGVAVDELRAELAYGLELHIAPPPSETPSAQPRSTGLRITSLDSSIGLPPRFGKRPTSVPEDWETAWKDIEQRWISRLDTLEIVDPDQPGGLLRREGVTASLRQSAKLRYPVDLTSITRPEENAPNVMDGLAGGIGWPFESVNIYEAVWRRKDPNKPVTGPAEIANLYLSSLGGWGQQKSSFDEERTTIYTRVGMGRTHYLCLERRGRIGVMWHPAKHVIIYERTVLPSRQFKNDQDMHYGRPVLRKVREFVEVMVKSRDYPEKASAPAARGFVLGCQFNTVQIPVSSAWGRDVGRVGWMVPLWRPGADPVVYPKPHVALRVAVASSVADGSVASELHEIDDPQKLIFFTSTEQGTGADTDKWHAYAGIDFPDVPALAIPDGLGLDQTDPDRRLVDAAAVEPGYEAFTYSLLPGGSAVNLGADRGGQGVSAVIRNATMARSAPRSSSTGKDQSPRALQLSKAQASVAAMTARVEAALIAGRGEILPALAKSTLDPADAAKQIRDRIASVLNPVTTDIEMALPAGAGSNTLDLCAILKSKQRAALDGARQRFEALASDMVQRIIDVNGFGASGLVLLDREIARLRDLAFVPAVTADKLDEIANAALDTIDRLAGELQAALAALEERVRSAAVTDADRLAEELDAAARRVEATAADCAGLVAASAEAVIPSIGEQLRNLAATVAGVASEYLARAVDDDLKLLRNAATAAQLSTARQALGDRIAGLIGALQQLIEAVAATIRDTVGEIESGLQDALDDAGAAFSDVLSQLQSNLVGVVGNPQPALANKLREELNKTFAGLKLQTDGLATKADAAIDGLCALTGGAAIDAGLQQLQALIGDLEGLLQAALQRPTAEIGNALSSLEREIVDELNRVGSRVMQDLASVARDVGESVEGAQQAINRLGDDSLRLLRAFGEPPRVPGLDFNRERLAYIFDELSDAIRITPSAALFDRLGDNLKGLGLRLPTIGIGDQLIPPDLGGLDFGRILPDFAGLKLENLVPDLALPSLPPDKVKVRHGVDAQSRRGWAEADIAIDHQGTTALFDFQPVRVQLVKPRFRATTRIEQTLGAAGESRARGSITGNWELVIAGFNVISFVDTPLEFDSQGGVRFAVRPEKVRMDSALQFLSDALSGYEGGEEGSGLTLEVLRENGLPVGATSRLYLPIPDIAAGTFAITNLRFGASFELAALPEFALTVRANIGRKTAPFNLTVFILGGGGWVEARSTYLPLQNLITTELTIGITASAGLALALGPIRGSIMMYFGVYGELYADSAGGRSLTVGITLLIVGQASLCGLITVGVQLLLEARYSDGGGLIGTGTLSYSIKIGWFFTLRVSASVRYEFVKGAGGAHALTASQHRERQLRHDYV